MIHRKRAEEPDVAISLVLGINCHADTVVDCGGERVWLKEVFLANGRRIGVGECCPESAPCAWHAALRDIDYRGGHGQPRTV